jgi:hypothetical protein
MYLLFNANIGVIHTNYLHKAINNSSHEMDVFTKSKDNDTIHLTPKHPRHPKWPFADLGRLL